MFLGLTSERGADVRGSTTTRENLLAPAHLDGQRRLRRSQVQGAQKYAVRGAGSTPTGLHAEGIGLNEVQRRAPELETSTTPDRAAVSVPTRPINIKAGGQLMNADAFKPVVVTYRHGAAVRLDQIANVIDNVEDNKKRVVALHQGPASGRAINLQVMRQPGRNTPSRSPTPCVPLLPTFVETLPPSVHLTIRGDRSKNIREAFSDIQWDDADHAAAGGRGDLRLPAQRLGDGDPGAGAAVLDPRHFSRSCRSLNFTLDNLSMMALILSIGFVVDDAIVMLEKHRPAHRAGQASARGGVDRLEGGRLSPSSR